jgi:hypothetical protein
MDTARLDLQDKLNKTNAQLIVIYEQMNRCWAGYITYKDVSGFPQKPYADESISMVEELCKQMATMAEEIKELRRQLHDS